MVMVMAWDYNPGRISGDWTGKMTSLMQPMRGMDIDGLGSVQAYAAN